MRKQPAVYILANRRLCTLYVGVTGSLRERIWQHREGIVPGFTQEHGVAWLVYYEWHEHFPAAIAREKLLKRWRRAWKIRLIEASNPYWNDRFEELEP